MTKDCKECESWHIGERCCWTQRGGLCDYDTKEKWRPKYHALEAKYQEALKVIEFYAEPTNFYGEDWANNLSDDDVDKVDDKFVGGAKAREFLEKLLEELEE